MKGSSTARWETDSEMPSDLELIDPSGAVATFGGKTPRSTDCFAPLEEWSSWELKRAREEPSLTRPHGINGSPAAS